MKLRCYNEGMPADGRRMLGGSVRLDVSAECCTALNSIADEHLALDAPTITGSWIEAKGCAVPRCFEVMIADEAFQGITNGHFDTQCDPWFVAGKAGADNCQAFLAELGRKCPKDCTHEAGHELLSGFARRCEEGEYDYHSKCKASEECVPFLEGLSAEDEACYAEALGLSLEDATGNGPQGLVRMKLRCYNEGMQADGCRMLGGGVKLDVSAECCTALNNVADEHLAMAKPDMTGSRIEAKACAVPNCFEVMIADEAFQGITNGNFNTQCDPWFVAAPSAAFDRCKAFLAEALGLSLEDATGNGPQGLVRMKLRCYNEGMQADGWHMVSSTLASSFCTHWHHSLALA